MNHSFINYSLAVEEIRLSHNLKNLSDLVNEFERSKRPQYLLKEITYLERRLKSLREERAA